MKKHSERCVNVLLASKQCVNARSASHQNDSLGIFFKKNKTLISIEVYIYFQGGDATKILDIQGVLISINQ